MTVLRVTIMTHSSLLLLLSTPPSFLSLLSIQFSYHHSQGSSFSYIGPSISTTCCRVKTKSIGVSSRSLLTSWWTQWNSIVSLNSAACRWDSSLGISSVSRIVHLFLFIFYYFTTRFKTKCKLNYFEMKEGNNFRDFIIVKV